MYSMQLFCRFPIAMGNTSTAADDDAPLLTSSASMSKNLFVPTDDTILDETAGDFEVPANATRLDSMCTTVKSLPRSPQSSMANLDVMVNNDKYEYLAGTPIDTEHGAFSIDAATTGATTVFSVPRQKPLPSKAIKKIDTSAGAKDNNISTTVKQPHQLHSRFPTDENDSMCRTSLPKEQQQEETDSCFDPIGIYCDTINHDLQLEHSLEIGDIDNLWLEHGLRHANDGESNPRVGQVLLFIGMYEMREGDYDEAFRHFHKASQCIDGNQKRVEAGFVHAEAQYNFGSLALESEKSARAEAYFAKALYMHQKNEMEHGRDPNASLVVARCLHRLGVVRTTNGKVDSALYTLQRCADICERRVDSDCATELLWTVLDSIGIAHFLAGDLEAAMLQHKDALQVKAAAVGEEDVSLVVNYKMLGYVCEASDKFECAAILYARAGELLTREYGRQENRRRRNKSRLSSLALQMREVQDLVLECLRLSREINDCV